MVPPGTKHLVHEKSNSRLSWAVYSTEAWYIGPSIDHYQCFKCYMPVTCRDRDADTVEFSQPQLRFHVYQQVITCDKQP